jgi:hypothetical protein
MVLVFGFQYVFLFGVLIQRFVAVAAARPNLPPADLALPKRLGRELRRGLRSGQNFGHSSDNFCVGTHRLELALRSGLRLRRRGGAINSITDGTRFSIRVTIER